MGQGKRRPAGDDHGYSLMEVLITTGVMSMVMVVVSSAFMQIYAGTRRIEQTSVAADQLDTSLRRLDRELRYATYVSNPRLGQDGSRWYVEFAIPPKPVPLGSPASPARCRQLQFDTKKNTLRMVNWDLPGTNSGAATTLATDVFIDNGALPFLFHWPGPPPTPIPVGVISQPTNKYSMVQLQFKVMIGEAVQKVDSIFTSQNITGDTIGSGKTDKRCEQAGRP